MRETGAVVSTVAARLFDRNGLRLNDVEGTEASTRGCATAVTVVLNVGLGIVP